MIDNNYLIYAIVIVGSYLIGSIPFGLVLGRLFKVGDIREIGSGNIGATNALRTGNKGFALAVLLGDGVKGVVAILLTKWLFGDVCACLPLIAGLAAVISHLFPVWLRFKGGKGVATCAGVILAWHWPTGLACLFIWIVTARLSRTSSLGAVIAAINLPIYAMALGGRDYAYAFALLSLLILWTHRGNIERLSKGEESTIKVNKG